MKLKQAEIHAANEEYDREQQEAIHNLCVKYYRRFKRLGFTVVNSQQVSGMNIELEDPLLNGYLTMRIVEFCNFKLAVGAEPKEKRKPLASAIRIEVLRRDGNKCRECGKTSQQTPLEVHHVIPVDKGGTDEMDNLLTLCEACNQSISDRRYTPR